MYPPGAAGKFLSSLLMSSPDIAHFDPLIEQNKTNTKCLNYIQNSFTSDLRYWIKNEPNQAEAWNLHFISSKYPRGNDLSELRFRLLCSQHANDHFKKSIQKNKMILFPWHKITIPEYFTDAKKIIITIDKKSENWFNNALWYKHYAVEKNKVMCLDHDYRLNPTMKNYFDKYNNQLYSSDSVKIFYKKNIIDNINKKIFNKKNKDIQKHNDYQNSVVIALSDILSVERLTSTMQNLSKILHFTPIDLEFIKQAHVVWSKCHDFNTVN